MGRASLKIGCAKLLAFTVYRFELLRARRLCARGGGILLSGGGKRREFEPLLSQTQTQTQTERSSLAAAAAAAIVNVEEVRLIRVT